MSGPLRPTPTDIVRSAHAKINVFLRVAGIRDDGFHELESLILPISAHDTVRAHRASQDITVMLTGERAGELEAAGGDSLVLRAARALASAAGISDPAAEIELEKAVPVAAGLGGGSSDAAAVLVVLNQLWNCGLTGEQLEAIGAGIGSDVPALLHDGPVTVRGRGEVLKPIARRVPLTYWVIAPQPFPVRTPDAFAWWDQDPRTTEASDAEIMERFLAEGEVEALGAALFNDLQHVVCERHPEVRTTIDAFRAAGAAGAVMTGSGPTVVALARDEAHAKRLSEAVERSFVVAAPPRP